MTTRTKLLDLLTTLKALRVLKRRTSANASMTDRQSVAANATVQNVLAGNLNEFLQANSLVNLYASAAAVGLNPGAGR